MSHDDLGDPFDAPRNRAESDPDPKEEVAMGDPLDREPKRPWRAIVSLAWIAVFLVLIIYGVVGLLRL